MITNETITEAPKDCDDTGTIWESGDLKFPVFIFVLRLVCELAYSFDNILNNLLSKIE